jgi:TIR domain
MKSVFISYRRESAPGEARSLKAELASLLGEGAVFMDVDNIRPGENFRSVLNKKLEACDVMLVVIDDEWVTDKAGRRRLEDPKDFVRMEVEAGLKRGILVTPVLVGRAQMPTGQDLPQEIAALADRQAFELRHGRWRDDVREMSRLLELDTSAPAPTPRPPPPPVKPQKNARARTYVLSAVGVVVVAIAAYAIIKLVPMDQPAPKPLPDSARMTIYPQIGSKTDEGKFGALRNTLPAAKYSVQNYEIRPVPPQNEIRYCYANNKQDALDLKALLDAKGFNPFNVKEIGGNCTTTMNKDVLEVWLSTGSPVRN